MKGKILIIVLTILTIFPVIAQKEGDVIINEIGNGGTKKATYHGGDYVELLVLKPEGVKLAGWYLTDLSNPKGTAKETEGSIKFSDEEGSVFNSVIPKGTYILICIGTPDEEYGNAMQNEKTDLKGDNKVVVFTETSENHIEKSSGKISLTGKDNLALVSAWDKNSAVDIFTWGGATGWTGCEITEVPEEALMNGEIIYFVPENNFFANNTLAQFWVSTSDADDSTPGSVNKTVDDSSLR